MECFSLVFFCFFKCFPGKKSNRLGKQPNPFKNEGFLHRSLSEFGFVRLKDCWIRQRTTRRLSLVEKNQFSLYTCWR